MHDKNEIMQSIITQPCIQDNDSSPTILEVLGNVKDYNRVNLKSIIVTLNATLYQMWPGCEVL